MPQAKSARAVTAPKLATCDVCGKGFGPRNGRQKRCGPECSTAAGRDLERQRHRDKAREMNEQRVRLAKACEWCGEEFSPGRCSQVTCGSVCRRRRKTHQVALSRAADPGLRCREVARLRDRLEADPHLQRRVRERERLWHSRRVADPDYRERLREYQRKWKRERLATDPEWRERIRERIREWTRNKRATDPEYRDRVNAQRRARRQRREQFEMWVNLSQLLEKANAVLNASGPPAVDR